MWRGRIFPPFSLLLFLLAYYYCYCAADARPRCEFSDAARDDRRHSYYYYYCIERADADADAGVLVALRANDATSPVDVIVDDARGIALSEDGARLTVALATCIVSVIIDEAPRLEGALAGRCDAAGRRDGPPRYARFAALGGAFGATSTHSLFFAAVDGRTRVVFGTPLRTRSVELNPPPHTLRVSPHGALLIFEHAVRWWDASAWMADYNGTSFDLLLLPADADETYASHPLVSSTSSSSSSSSYFWADAHLSTTATTLTVWLLDGDGTVHGAHFLLLSPNLAMSTPWSTWRPRLTPTNEGETHPPLLLLLLSMRVLPAETATAAEGWAWNGSAAVALQLTRAAPSATPEAGGGCDHTITYGPGGGAHRAPPGGYATLDGRFVPCQNGTASTVSGAASPDVCTPCPPGTIAPARGAAVCAACPSERRFQDASRTACLQACPRHYHDATPTECMPCPVAGYEGRGDGSAPCAPCPAGTFAPVVGAPCTKCPPGQTSAAGATECVPMCYASSSERSMAFVHTLHGARPGCAHVVAIRANGTLWMGCGQEVVRRALPMRGVGLTDSHHPSIPAPTAVTGLALAPDASVLFAALEGGGLLRIASDGRTVGVVLAGVHARALGAAAVRESGGVVVSALWWLFWLDARSGALKTNYGDESRDGVGSTLYDDAPRVALLDGLVAMFAMPSSSNAEEETEETLVPVVYELDPMQLVFMPLASPSPFLFQSLDAAARRRLVGATAWMRRGMGGTLLGDGTTLLAWLPDDDDDSGGEGGTLLLRTAVGAASLDDAPERASSPPIASAHLLFDDASRLAFFVTPTTGMVRVLAWRAPCECARADHYLSVASASLLPACVPCPPGAVAPAGARGCTAVCARGEFLDVTLGAPACAPCPATLFWTDGPPECPFMWETADDAHADALTLAQAAALHVDTLPEGAIVRLLLGLPGDQARQLARGALQRLDALGPLWHIDAPSADHDGVHDPGHVAVFAAQGLRVPATMGCFDRSIAFPWDADRERQGGGGGNASSSCLPLFVFSASSSSALLARGDGCCWADEEDAAHASSWWWTEVGWPARYNCTHPSYFWAYPSPTHPGGACLPCTAKGTFAFDDAATACTTPTHTAALAIAECPSGFFLRVSPPPAACVPCAPGTFYDGGLPAAVDACWPKTVHACPIGHYVREAVGGTSDNTCVACDACAPNEATLPSDASICPGDTVYQPYVCAGQLTRLTPSVRLALEYYHYDDYDTHDGDGIIRMAPSVVYVPCGRAPPDGGEWTWGPLPDVCYFRCPFGAEPDAIAAYLLMLTLTTGVDYFQYYQLHYYYYFYHQEEAQGTSSASSEAVPFPVIAPVDANRVCNQPSSIYYGQEEEEESAAATNTTNQSTGEVDARAARQQRQHRGGADDRCLPGWFAPPAASNDNNHPSSSRTCVQCPPTIDTAVLVSDAANVSASYHWQYIDAEGGGCTYACQEGVFYPNPDTTQPPSLASLVLDPGSRPCLPCRVHQPTQKNAAEEEAAEEGAANAPRWLCQAGTRVSDPCTAEPCTPCDHYEALTKDGTAVMVPTEDATCRVRCRGGFHMVSVAEGTHGQVLLLNSAFNGGGWDPSEIECVPCVRRATLECPAECPWGTLAPHCTPCDYANRMPINCTLPGTMPPPCSGGPLLSACIVCPQLPHGFVYVTPGTCDTACMNGYGASTIGCMACSRLFVPRGAPFLRYDARWDAAPARRWWPAAFDPPHLPPRPTLRFGHEQTLRLEPTASVCWPVREEEGGDGDGYAAAFMLPAIVVTSHQAEASRRRGRRRRLLHFQAVTDCPPGTFRARLLRWRCAPCPPGFRCPGGKTAPRLPCPMTTTTTTMGACAACIRGFARTSPAADCTPELPTSVHDLHVRDALRDRTRVEGDAMLMPMPAPYATWRKRDEEDASPTTTTTACAGPNEVHWRPFSLEPSARCVCAVGFARTRAPPHECAPCRGRRYMGDAVCTHIHASDAT